MTSYGTFLLVTLITVISPGPGVLMTLSNSLKNGLRGAVPGILGISSGTFIVAIGSATGVGLLIDSFPATLILLKYLGSAYLCYLALRLWSAYAPDLPATTAPAENWHSTYRAGIVLQLTNPKALLFFVSILPQFVDTSMNYRWQLLLMISSYSAMVVVIHLLYAWIAKGMHQRLHLQQHAQLINRLFSVLFLCFATSLAYSGLFAGGG